MIGFRLEWILLFAKTRLAWKIVILSLTLLMANAIAFTLLANFIDAPVLENLQDTDGFAFLPDGRLFISERITGKLRKLLPIGNVKRHL